MFFIEKQERNRKHLKTLVLSWFWLTDNTRVKKLNINFKDIIAEIKEMEMAGRITTFLISTIYAIIDIFILSKLDLNEIFIDTLRLIFIVCGTFSFILIVNGIARKRRLEREARQEEQKKREFIQKTLTREYAKLRTALKVLNEKENQILKRFVEENSNTIYMSQYFLGQPNDLINNTNFLVSKLMPFGYYINIKPAYPDYLYEISPLFFEILKHHYKD